MASDTSVCGICSLRQITKTSNHWCPECEEAICDECKVHHKLLKATRSHETIPISNYKSLPTFITDIQQSCSHHNEKYQQYCNEHTLPICFKCIKVHQKCTVIPLEEVIINAKTSEQFQDIETRLVDLLENVYQINKDRKANADSIKETKKRHVEEIQQIKIEINKHLDNLEKHILKDLEEKETQCQNSIQKVLSSVKDKETIISQCQANIQNIKQYASDLQTFLGMREIEVKVYENEKYLQSMIDANSFEQLNLVWNIDPDVHSILYNVKSFGSYEIKALPSNITFRRTKDKEAQLQVAAAKKTVSDVKVIQQQTISTNGNIVRGCCMSEGDFLITDYCAKQPFIVLASDGTFKYRMSLYSSHGFDTTFIDENTVAVTTGNGLKTTGIDIIDIQKQSRMKFIELPGCPYGITCDRDSLFVCVERRGIYKVNTLNYTTSHVISCNLPCLSYVSVFDDKIYYTDNNDDSAVCCDRNGARVWSFKDNSVLKCPRGITLDNDGNVYVVGESSMNVVIISNDGKHRKEILKKEDGLCAPSAIFFEKQKSKLLVANLSQTSFLYNVR